MGRPKGEIRTKYVVSKMNELEYDLADRVSKSMHLNKSEMIRQLIWQKYAELCKSPYQIDTDKLNLEAENVNS